MKKKAMLALISSLMVLTLILASCETETVEKVEEDDTDDVVRITETETTTGPTGGEEEQVELSSDEPQYGGTHNIALAWDISNWANGLEVC
ncbi:MAG: hypothetical protein JSU58_04375 [Dehalococcoidales bacterium]|nr:MAG: hypothetical protein JSU58_04375 [Dehalococcoidales bacterium]